MPQQAMWPQCKFDQHDKSQLNSQLGSIQVKVKPSYEQYIEHKDMSLYFFKQMKNRFSQSQSKTSTQETYRMIY